MAERHLLRINFDLFVASTEPISATLAWSFLFLAKNPQIQDWIREELLEKLGKTGKVEGKSKKELLRLEATLMECHRRANIAVLGIPKCTTRVRSILCINKKNYIFKTHNDNNLKSLTLNFHPL